MAIIFIVSLVHPLIDIERGTASTGLHTHYAKPRNCETEIVHSLIPHRNQAKTAGSHHQQRDRNYLRLRSFRPYIEYRSIDLRRPTFGQPLYRYIPLQPPISRVIRLGVQRTRCRKYRRGTTTSSSHSVPAALPSTLHPSHFQATFHTPDL